MTDTTQWHRDMAHALQRRDHAQRMVTRWEGQVAHAQDVIRELVQTHQDVMTDGEPTFKPQEHPFEGTE